tara:strand:- start:386 stop:1483 length:1098 start_codon:yes stop_codon:yes gene_type:complete
MKYISLFSGVGGLDRAVESRFGAKPIAFVEANEYCRRVLKKRWPGVPVFDDVRTFSAKGETPDLCIGGPPCQDLSTAGRGAGLLEGGRSSLFFDFARIVLEAKPKTLIIENVPALLSKWRRQVEGALPGYRLTWVKVAAAHVPSCPHLRRRVFVIGERGGSGSQVIDAGKLPKIDRWPSHNASTFQENQSPSTYLRRSAELVERGTRPIGLQLPVAVQPASRWPTATRNDYKNAGYQHARGKDFPALPGATGSATQRGGAQPTSEATGKLSPDWVELLMGFPHGWTDLACDQPIDKPFPAPMVRGDWGDSPQHTFEPPRLTHNDKGDRRDRLKALGNAVVSAQALMALDLAKAGRGQLDFFGVKT